MKSLDVATPLPNSVCCSLWCFFLFRRSETTHCHRSSASARSINRHSRRGNLSPRWPERAGGARGNGEVYHAIEIQFIYILFWYRVERLKYSLVLARKKTHGENEDTCIELSLLTIQMLLHPHRHRHRSSSLYDWEGGSDRRHRRGKGGAGKNQWDLLHTREITTKLSPGFTIHTLEFFSQSFDFQRILWFF